MSGMYGICGILDPRGDRRERGLDLLLEVAAISSALAGAVIVPATSLSW